MRRPIRCWCGRRCLRRALFGCVRLRGTTTDQNLLQIEVELIVDDAFQGLDLLGFELELRGAEVENTGGDNIAFESQAGAHGTVIDG